ncbi:MAG: hypothetical protein B6D36_05555 [Planctomycetes bacterium UTPLA1]|nr:MAG: hypothetical protein B6D36_05555 [Planctomycetes bacterium UTPLA1]
MRANVAVSAILDANALLAAKVGNRNYFGIVPQRTVTPYTAIQVISDIPEQTSEGQSGLVNAKVQVTAFANTAKEASDTADLVKLALDNAFGEFNGVRIHRITRLDGGESPGSPVGSSEKPLAGYYHEFEVPYEEAVPA